MTRRRFRPWMLVAIVFAVALGGCATLDRTVTTGTHDTTPAASPRGGRSDVPSPLQAP